MPLACTIDKKPDVKDMNHLPLSQGHALIASQESMLFESQRPNCSPKQLIRFRRYRRNNCHGGGKFSAGHC